MVKFVLIISEASVTAGLAALAVMLIRLAMKKAPKRWAYALWAVVFFRCLCPFSAESALSLFNVIPDHATETVEMVDSSGTVSEENVYVPAIVQVERTLENYGYTTPPPAVAPSKPVPKKNPFHMYTVIFTVWVVGAAAMALYGVISYILLMRKLRTAVKTEDGVYESDLISTAFSAGFFPPKIYVPCGLFEEERKLIIAHERVHIRRLDYIVKPVAFIELAVHWFNPVIWLAFALMTRDMELSCDEAVLKIFGAGEKKAYSEALLHVSMKRSGLVDNYKFMPLAFAETGIKGRVRNVLKYKKPTLIVTVLAAAVVIAACAALGTDAKSKTEDIPEEIEYIEYRQGVTNNFTDVNGNKITFFVDRLNLPKNSGIYYSRALVEGEIALNSATVTDADGSLIESMSTVSFGDSSLKRLIMAVDMTEFKINSLEVFSEQGKNILRAQFEFTLAEDAALPMRDGLIRLGDDEEPRMLMVEGGGNDRVYTVSAEYELKSNDSGRFAFMLKEFGNIPVYVNSDLIKYYELSEGETVYTLDNGKRVFIENKPTETANIDDAGYVIALDPDTSKTARSQSVLVGMRGKNNELERYCGVDFSNKEITSFEVNNIQVMPSLFTAVMRITFAEGEEVSVIDVNNADESEPEEFRSVRLIKSDGENEYLLYLTAVYDTSSVDEYVLKLYGFDNVTSQINFTEEQDITHINPIITINTNLELNKDKSAEYTRISGGSAQFTLETGETGYAAYGLSELSIILGNDKGTFSVRGIKDKGVSIGCFKTISKGSEEIDFCDVLDFGDNPVTAVTIENMYTEKIVSNVKLYTEIKVACPESDGLMNNMAVNDDDCEIAIAKLINDEYLFTIVKEYEAADIVIDGFAVVISGFETPAEINTDYEAPVYINSALDPHMPQTVTYEAYERVYNEEDMQKRIEEERRKLHEEEQRRREEEEYNNFLNAIKSSYPALQYPVYAPISSNYGNREETRDFNKGINFAVSEGTPVYAAGKGTVLNADDDNNGYGLCVIIDHGSGELATLYAHLSEISVKEGDEVNGGDLIGYSGKTGSAYEATLHFEVRINGAHTDPVNYLAAPESYTEKAVLAWYLGTDTITGITLYNDGTFLVENYTSSFWLPERPEKSYKFENGILSLEYTNGSVQCLEAVGNDLVYRKDLSDENYITGMPSVNDTFELQSGTSLNGERIEMDTIELNGKTYYLVSNETQLRAIGGSVYGLDKNYMQQCDIELSPDEWKPVGTRRNPFTGSYNGNGFEIKGLTMADPKAPLVGMFGCAENANIYNITLRDYDIEKAGSKAKKKSVAPIVAINYGSRVYDNNVYPKGE